MSHYQVIVMASQVLAYLTQGHVTSLDEVPVPPYHLGARAGAHRLFAPSLGPRFTAGG
jgi:hypothetical protein